MKLSHLAILTAAFAVTTAIAQQAAAPTADTAAAAPTAEAVVAPAPVAVVADTGPAKAGDPKQGGLMW